MATAGAQSQTSQASSAAQQNRQARHLILHGGSISANGQTVKFAPAIDVWQPLNPILPAAVGPGSVLTFNLRNVGLVKRLICRFTATVTAGATSVQSLSKLGLANLISSVVFSDLASNQRINTQGWHLTALSTAKRRRIFGAAGTTDTPLGYGNNNTRTMYAPATIAANGTTEIDFQLEIPFVKNNHDLRGAIYADVTQANMQVQITLNPNMFVSSTADPSFALYQSAGADLASLSGLSLQVYQNYLDQLPAMGGAPILPAQDIGTAYLLNNTASGLPIANQDNGIAFVNSRKYESVAFVFDNNGVLNVNGSDLQSVQLQSANFTSIYNLDGRMLSLMERDQIFADFPAGMHYLDFRHRPIDTDQYGNMQIVFRPSAVGGSGAFFAMGWEAYGIIGQVNQGGSLPMGGG